jgi:hypothetical protein
MNQGTLQIERMTFEEIKVRCVVAGAGARWSL